MKTVVNMNHGYNIAILGEIQKNTFNTIDKVCVECYKPFNKKKGIIKTLKIDGWCVCNKCAPLLEEKMRLGKHFGISNQRII